MINSLKRKTLSTVFFGFAKQIKKMTEKQDVTSRLNTVVADFFDGKGSKLAAAIGSSTATVHAYLTGKTKPNFDSIERICTHCGVSPTWLIMGFGPKLLRDSATAPTDDRRFIPLVNQAAFDTGGAALRLTTTTVDGRLPIAAHNGASAAQIAALVVIDDAMRPDVLAGDVVVFDAAQRDQAATDGALVVVVVGGAAVVRQLAGDLLVARRFEMFAPRPVKPQQIVGRVVEIRRALEMEG